MKSLVERIEGLVLNESAFRRMAIDDLAGFQELAREFFIDTRRRLPVWRDLHQSGDLSDLAVELHRCRGGACVFGLQRLELLLARWEQCSMGMIGFDVGYLERELIAAERRIAMLC